MLLTIQHFIAVQLDDAHNRHPARIAMAPNSSFIYDIFGILSRLARLNEAIKILDPASTKKAVLKRERYSTISGHPEARSM